jgi:hypothetical protein
MLEIARVFLRFRTDSATKLVTKSMTPHRLRCTSEVAASQSLSASSILARRR